MVQMLLDPSIIVKVPLRLIFIGAASAVRQAHNPDNIGLLPWYLEIH